MQLIPSTVCRENKRLSENKTLKKVTWRNNLTDIKVMTPLPKHNERMSVIIEGEEEDEEQGGEANYLEIVNLKSEETQSVMR